MLKIKGEEYLVGLVSRDKIKKDCPVAIVYKESLWEEESILTKALSYLKFNYSPSEESIQRFAHKIFKEEVFGTYEDLGPALFDLMIWYQNLDWKLEHLTKDDWDKADALEQMSKISRARYTEHNSTWLNLRLYPKQNLIVPLVYPVVGKTPIRSIKNFVDVHSRFAFNSIRKSNHSQADDLISYLYEVLLLNQKTANLLHKSVRYIYMTQTKKGDSLLTIDELEAITNNDSIITYLKSSIEKLVYLVGHIYGIKNLEGKKEHGKRLKALDKEIPDKIKALPYYEFFEEFISSKQIDQLNKYRTGILHKKGLSVNQPHKFSANKKAHIALKKMFDYLFDQHCKNSVMLIAVLSLLTDKLVELDYPDKMFFSIPYDKLNLCIEKIEKTGNKP